jgi:ribosome biogenesis protein ENP2
MAYSYTSCDLLVVGVSPAVYRLNLDQGRFFSPLETQATAINVSGKDVTHRCRFEWIREKMGTT